MRCARIACDIGYRHYRHAPFEQQFLDTVNFLFYVIFLDGPSFKLRKKPADSIERHSQLFLQSCRQLELAFRLGAHMIPHCCLGPLQQQVSRISDISAAHHLRTIISKSSASRLTGKCLRYDSSLSRRSCAKTNGPEIVPAGIPRLSKICERPS